MRDRAEQVAEEIPRPRLCGDVQVHLIEVDHEAEQIEVQRAERQIEDLAPADVCAGVTTLETAVADEVRDLTGCVRERAGEVAVRDELARRVEREARDREDAVQGARPTASP